MKWLLKNAPKPLSRNHIRLLKCYAYLCKLTVERWKNERITLEVHPFDDSTPIIKPPLVVNDPKQPLGTPEAQMFEKIILACQTKHPYLTSIFLLSLIFFALVAFVKSAFAYPFSIRNDARFVTSILFELFLKFSSLLNPNSYDFLLDCLTFLVLDSNLII